MRVGVRADAEERDVAEREVARVAADQVPGRRQRGVHHDEDADVDDPVLAEDERRERRAARRRRAPGATPARETRPLRARPARRVRTVPAAAGSARRSGRGRTSATPRSARSRLRARMLADADDERCDDGAAEAPEPAQHDDREQARDQVVVAARVEREHDPVDGARGGRGRDAQPEADRRDALRDRCRAARPRPGSGSSRARIARSGCARGSGRAASGSTSDVEEAVHAHLRDDVAADAPRAVRRSS